MSTQTGAAVSDDLSRAEFAYTRLMQMLRTQELRAGQRLREIDLAERLGVSRTPVREALRRIASEGLITLVAGRGLVVTEFDKQQVRELYAMRGILEGAAAQLAARNASTADLGMMRHILERCGAAIDSPDESMRLNTQFHRTIHQAAHNRYLEQALANMADSLALLPGTTFNLPDRAAIAHAEHSGIVDALAQREADRAEQLMRRHIEFAGAARVQMMFESFD